MYVYEQNQHHRHRDQRMRGRGDPTGRALAVHSDATLPPAVSHICQPFIFARIHIFPKIFHHTIFTFSAGYLYHTTIYYLLIFSRVVRENIATADRPRHTTAV